MNSQSVQLIYLYVLYFIIVTQPLCCTFYNFAVNFALSVAGSVCEGAGSLPVCVILESDVERDTMASIITFDGYAQSMITQ